MAKYVQGYKGRIIKATTARDNTTFDYWVIDKEFSTIEPIWECDSLQECFDWIDSDN